MSQKYTSPLSRAIADGSSGGASAPVSTLRAKKIRRPRYVPDGLGEIPDLSLASYEGMCVLAPSKTVPTRDYLKSIANKFLQRPDMLFKDVEIVIADREFGNMSIQTFHSTPIIFVEKPYLLAARSEDELAYVIAHELAHKQINLLHKQSLSGRFAENSADKLAITWMIEAGYNWKAARDYYSRYDVSIEHTDFFKGSVERFVKADHSEGRARAKYIETFIGAWINTQGFKAPPEPPIRPIDKKALNGLYQLNFESFMDHHCAIQGYHSQGILEQLKILLQLKGSQFQTGRRRHDFMKALQKLGEEELKYLPEAAEVFSTWYQKLPHHIHNTDIGTLVYAAANGSYYRYKSNDDDQDDKDSFSVNEHAGFMLSPALGYTGLRDAAASFIAATSFKDALKAAKEINVFAKRYRYDNIITTHALDLPYFDAQTVKAPYPWKSFYPWVAADESGEIVKSLWHLGASGDEELWKHIKPKHLKNLDELGMISIPAVWNYAPAETKHLADLGMRARFNKGKIDMDMANSYLYRDSVWRAYNARACDQREKLSELVSGTVKLGAELNAQTLKESPKAYAKLLQWQIGAASAMHSDSSQRNTILKIRKKLVADLEAVAADGATDMKAVMNEIFIKGFELYPRHTGMTLMALLFKTNVRLNGEINHGDRASLVSAHATLFSDPLAAFYMKNARHLDVKVRGKFLGHLSSTFFRFEKPRAPKVAALRDVLGYAAPKTFEELTATLKTLQKIYGVHSSADFAAIEVQGWVLPRKLAPDHADIAGLAPVIEMTAFHTFHYRVIDQLADGIERWTPEKSKLGALNALQAVSLYRFYDSSDLLKNDAFRNALIARIKETVESEADPKIRRELCENILLKGQWHRGTELGKTMMEITKDYHLDYMSQLKSPELIDWALRQWAGSIRSIHGVDNGSKAYTKRTLGALREFHQHSHSPAMTYNAAHYLCDEVVAQRETAFECRDFLKSKVRINSSDDARNLNYGVALSEALIKFFSETDSKCRDFIDFLSSPMTRRSRAHVTDMVMTAYEEYERQKIHSQHSDNKNNKFFEDLHLNRLPPALQWQRLNKAFEHSHQLFWEQPLALRAVVMDQLLVPARNLGHKSDSAYDTSDNPYRKATEYVLDKLFPLFVRSEGAASKLEELRRQRILEEHQAARQLEERRAIKKLEELQNQRDKYWHAENPRQQKVPAHLVEAINNAVKAVQSSRKGPAHLEEAIDNAVKDVEKNTLTDDEVKKRTFIRTFLHAYIANSHQTERSLLLSAFMTASLNQGEENEAQRLARILEIMGPAYTKLGQAIYQHPKTPDDYRDAMRHLNKKTNLPARWDHHERIEEVLPPSLVDRIVWRGPIEGAASFKVVSHIQFDNGQVETLGYLRKNAFAQAIYGYEKMAKTARDVIKKMPELADVGVAIVEMIEQTKELTQNETDLHIGAQQTLIGQKLFDPMVIATDGYEFHFQFMPWRMHTDEAMIMQTGRGVHWTELPETTADEKRYKKAAAKASLTLTLDQVLAGSALDMDRHIGQSLMGAASPKEKYHMIPLFDAGGISLKPPTEEEIHQLGQCFARVVKNGKFDLQLIPDEMLASIVDIQKTAKKRPSYLLAVQKAFLASSDFTRVLDRNDLFDIVIGLYKSGRVHPVLARELQGAMIGTSINTPAIQQFMGVVPGVVVTTKPPATVTLGVYSAVNDNRAEAALAAVNVGDKPARRPRLRAAPLNQARTIKI